MTGVVHGRLSKRDTESRVAVPSTNSRQYRYVEDSFTYGNKTLRSESS